MWETYYEKYLKDAMALLEDCPITIIDTKPKMSNADIKPSISTIDIKHNVIVSQDKFTIKKVIFNDPATIVYWKDGTKTVVKCMKGDVFTKDNGLAMCFAKRLLGDDFKKVFNKYCNES